MNICGFKNWLMNCGLKRSTVENRVANCVTVEREQGIDLDVCYENDRCESLISLLTYSSRDRMLNNSARHSIPINGDIYKGTATYRAAVKKYVHFKDATGGTVYEDLTSPKNVQENCKSNRAKPFPLNKCNEFKKKLDDFYKWLLEEAGLKKNSANQYKTYIKKLRLAFNEQFGEMCFERAIIDYCNDLSEEKLLQCSFFIEDRIRNVRGMERKKWNDWRSAFHRFEEFLHDIMDVYNKDIDVCPKEIKKVSRQKNKLQPRQATQLVRVDELNVPAQIAVYTHSELKRAFIGRLKTQSRYYPVFDLLFPTRLLTKIFRNSRGNEWKNWMEEDLMNMQVLTSGRSSVKFSEVRQFRFLSDGTMLVATKEGLEFEMMTHTPDRSRIVKEEARQGLRDVSIDHIVPLEVVLHQKKDELKGLRCLTDLFWEYCNKIGRDLHPRSEREWANDFYRQLCVCGHVDNIRELIARDLEKLDLKYELMDTRYNAIRGNEIN